MSTAKDLGSGLFGKGRRNVLGALFANPDRPMYLREISTTAGVGPGQVQRELENLLRLRLILRTRQGRQYFYRPNPDAPIFDELKSIVFKTFGITDAVKRVLDGFKRKIKWAFIFGSIAGGNAVGSSDVDLMVVTDQLGPSDLLEPLLDVESRLRRKISLKIYGVKEFERLARAGHHFIGGVLSKPKLMILGDGESLERLAARKSQES
jgi:predicted nucleotidyltransferase